MSGGKLVVMDRSGRDIKRFSLPKGLVTLGSDPGCDIRILLPSISGHHANVVVHAKQTIVRHVSNSGETLVNGQPISVAPLQHGDTITLGDRSLRWEYDDPQAAKPAVQTGSLIVKRGKQKGGRGRKRASDPASRQLNTSVQYQLELNHRASMPASTGSGKPVARVPPQRRDTHVNNDTNPRLVVKPHRPYAQTNKRQRTSKNDSTQELGSSYTEVEQDKSKRKSSVKTPDLTTKASMWIESRKSTPRRSVIQSPALESNVVDSPRVKSRNSRVVSPSDNTLTPRATRMSASPKSVETPKSLTKLATPKSSRKVTTPKSAARVSTPKSASKVATPKSAAKVATPKSAAKVATPKSAAKVTIPKSAAKVATPKSAAKVATPKSTVKVATPKSAAKITPPKSATKALTPKSGSRSSNVGSTPKVERTPRSTRTPTPAKISPRLTQKDTPKLGKVGTSKIPVVARTLNASAKKLTPLRTFVLRKTITPKTRDILIQSAKIAASTAKVTKIQDPLKIDHTKQAALMLMTASKTKLSPKAGFQRSTPGLVVTRATPVKTPIGRKSPPSVTKSPKSAKKSPKSAKKSPTARQSIEAASNAPTPVRSSSASSTSSRRSNKSFTDSLLSLDSTSRSARSHRSTLIQSPDPYSLPSPRKSALKNPSTKTRRKGESIKFDLSNVEYSYDSSDALILTNTTRRSVSDSSLSDDETLKFLDISSSLSPRSPVRSRSSKILEKSLGSPVSIVSPSSSSKRNTLTPGSPRSRPSLRGSLMVEKVMLSSPKSKSMPTSVQKKRGSASPNNMESYSIVDLVSFDSPSSSLSSVYGSARSGRNSLFVTPQGSARQSRESLGNTIINSSTPYIIKPQKTPKRSTSLTSPAKTPASTRRSKSTSSIQHITINSTRASRSNDSDLFIISTRSPGDSLRSPKRMSNAKRPSQTPKSTNSSRASTVASRTLNPSPTSNASTRKASKRSLSLSPVSTPSQKSAKTTPKSTVKSPKVTPKSTLKSPKVTPKSTLKSPKVTPKSVTKSPKFTPKSAAKSLQLSPGKIVKTPRKSAPSLILSPRSPSKTPRSPLKTPSVAKKSLRKTLSAKSPIAAKGTPGTRKSSNTSVASLTSPVSTRKSEPRVSARRSNSVLSPRSPSYSPLTPTSARNSSGGRKINPKSVSPKHGPKSPKRQTPNANLNDDGLHTPENSITPEEAGTPVLNIQTLIDSSFTSVSSQIQGRKSGRKSTGFRTSAKSSRSAGRSKSLNISTAKNKSRDNITPTSKITLPQEVVKRNHSTAKKPVSRREFIDTLNDSDIGKQLFSSPVKRKLSQSMSEFSRTQLFDDDASPRRKRSRNTSGRSREETVNIQPDIFVSPLNTPNNSPRLSGIKRMYAKNTPHNDLTNVKGVRSLLKTPRTRKSVQNDLTNVSGVKNTFAKSPANDLRRVSGVKSLFQSGRKNKSPANNLTNISGVKEVLTGRSPRNDLCNVSGVKKTLRKSPKNDLTDVRGVKRLFRQEKSQGISDVSGVEELFNESYNSHKGSSRNISYSENLFDRMLGKPPIKATYASKSFAKSPATSRGLKKTKSLHVPVDYIVNNVEEWLEQEIQKRLHKNDSRTNIATPKGVPKELQKLATDTVEGNSPLRTSRVRNSTINDSKATNRSEGYSNASTLPLKKRSLMNASGLKNKSKNESLPIKKRAIVHSTPVKGRPNLTANVSELGRVSPISADKTRFIEDGVRVTPQASPKSKSPGRKSRSVKKTPERRNATPISSPKQTPNNSPRRSKSGPSTPVASSAKVASPKTPPKTVLKRSIRKKTPSAKFASAKKILASKVVTPTQSQIVASKTPTLKQAASPKKTAPTPKKVATPKATRGKRSKQATPTPKKLKQTPKKAASKQKAPAKQKNVKTSSPVKSKRGANKKYVPSPVKATSPPKAAKGTRGRNIKANVQPTLVVAKKTPIMSPSPKPNKRNARKQASQTTPKQSTNKEIVSRGTRGKGKATLTSPKPIGRAASKPKTPKGRATKVSPPEPKAASPKTTRGKKPVLVIAKPSPQMKPATPKATRSKKPVAKSQTPKPKRGAKIEKSPAKTTKQVPNKKTAKISPKKSAKVNAAKKKSPVKKVAKNATPVNKVTRKTSPVTKATSAKTAKKAKSPIKSKSPVKASPVKRTRKPVSPAPKRAKVEDTKKRGQVAKSAPIAQEPQTKGRKRKSEIEPDTPKKVPRKTKSAEVGAKKGAKTQKTPAKGKATKVVAKKVQTPPASPKGKKRKTEPAKVSTPVAKKTRKAAKNKTPSPVKTKARGQKNEPKAAASTTRSRRR